VNRVQRTFGDEASVQITTDDIIRWINDAQLEICSNNEELLQTSALTDIVAGQAEYDVPDDMWVLRSLAFQGYRVKHMSFAEFNEYIDGFDSANSPYGPGIPEVFMVWEGKITLFPKPSSSITGGLKMYYSKQPDSVGNLADPLTVPLPYHVSIVEFCMARAYELDEDLEKAAYAKGKFDAVNQKLNDRQQWEQREYYPRITTLPEDENYGSYGYWGGYY
jgi:hypothetical protein